jgi:hypothetical protein
MVRSALTVLFLLTLAFAVPASEDLEGEEPEVELTGELFVATSVCEAHELRENQERDPTIRIEIPPEFAGQWPSRSACVSAELAWDVEAPGPMQPIPFSHKHHALLVIAFWWRPPRPRLGVVANLRPQQYLSDLGVGIDNTSCFWWQSISWLQ